MEILAKQDKPTIEFINIRDSYRAEERVIVTYRVLDSLSIHPADVIVLTKYPWYPDEGLVSTYGLWNTSSSVRRGINRDLSITIPRFGGENQVYQFCYLQPCIPTLSLRDDGTDDRYKLLGKSKLFCLDNTEFTRTKVSGMKFQNTDEMPLNLSTKVDHSPRHLFHDAGIIQELLKIQDKRNYLHPLHKLSTQQDGIYEMLESASDIDNTPERVTADNIDTRQDNQNRFDSLLERFVESQKKYERTVSTLQNQIMKREQALSQAESGSKQRLQMEYEGAIKSHKYNVDAITKSIQDIQQRNNRLMDIQKTVINSRRMYDRNIKRLEEEIQRYDMTIETLQNKTSDNQFTSHDKHFQCIQDLYERIEKADEKLNELTQNLGKSNSNADELDTKKRAENGKARDLQMKLIGLQKSKSSEPTKSVAGSKRKGAAASEIKQDVEVVSNDGRRQTQSEMGTVSLVNENTEPAKLLLKLLTTAAPPHIRQEWFEKGRQGNHASQRHAPGCEDEETEIRGSESLNTESSSDSSLASAMRQLFTRISEERTDQQSRTVKSSESLATAMQRLFATNSDNEVTTSPSPQSSTDSLAEAMRRLFRQNSVDKINMKNKAASKTSITDSKSFARIMRELFVQEKQPESVASSESFARIMQELFSSKSDVSLASTDSSSSFDWGNFRALFDSDTSLDTVIESAEQRSSDSQSDIELALDTLSGSSQEDLHRALPTASKENLKNLQEAVSNLISDVKTISSSKEATTPKSNHESVTRAISFILNKFKDCTTSKPLVTSSAATSGEKTSPAAIRSFQLKHENTGAQPNTRVNVKGTSNKPDPNPYHNRTPCFSFPTSVTPLSIPTSPALHTTCNIPSSFIFSWPQSVVKSQIACHSNCVPSNPTTKLTFSSHFANSMSYGTFPSQSMCAQDRTPAFTAIATDLQTTEAVTHSTPPMQAKTTPTATDTTKQNNNITSEFKKCCKMTAKDDKGSSVHSTAANSERKFKHRDRRITKRKRSRKE